MEEVMNIMDELRKTLEGSSNCLHDGSGQLVTFFLLAIIVIGLIVCCFGLKLSRVLAAIVGLALGALLGTGISLGIGLNRDMLLIVAAAAGVICGVLFGVLRRFGIFFLVLLQTMSIYIGIVKPQNLFLAAVGLAVGILMAILSVFWTDPVVVIVTGICGGLFAGSAAAALFGIDGRIWTGYVVGGITALIGIWIQFMMQSRKIGKKEKVYSKKVREQMSMESEVEKARKILEDTDAEAEPELGSEIQDDDPADDIKIVEEEL